MTKATKPKKKRGKDKMTIDRERCARLNKLLEGSGLRVYSLVSDESNCAISLYTFDSCVTFDTLQKLSETLHTKNININAETRQDEYYPSDNPSSEVMLWVCGLDWAVIDEV